MVVCRERGGSRVNVACKHSIERQSISLPPVPVLRVLRRRHGYLLYRRSCHMPRVDTVTILSTTGTTCTGFNKRRLRFNRAYCIWDEEHQQQYQAVTSYHAHVLRHSKRRRPLSARQKHLTRAELPLPTTNNENGIKQSLVTTATHKMVMSPSVVCVAHCACVKAFFLIFLAVRLERCWHDCSFQWCLPRHVAT